MGERRLKLHIRSGDRVLEADGHRVENLPFQGVGLPGGAVDRVPEKRM